MKVTETSHGVRISCENCSFKMDSLTANITVNHICSDHTVVKYEKQAVRFEKTHRVPVVVKPKERR